VRGGGSAQRSRQSLDLRAGNLGGGAGQHLSQRQSRSTRQILPNASDNVQTKLLASDAERRTADEVLEIVKLGQNVNRLSRKFFQDRLEGNDRRCINRRHSLGVAS